MTSFFREGGIEEPVPSSFFSTKTRGRGQSHIFKASQKEKEREKERECFPARTFLG